MLLCFLIEHINIYNCIYIGNISRMPADSYVSLFFLRTDDARDELSFVEPLTEPFVDSESTSEEFVGLSSFLYLSEFKNRGYESRCINV